MEQQLISAAESKRLERYAVIKGTYLMKIDTVKKTVLVKHLAKLFGASTATVYKAIRS